MNRIGFVDGKKQKCIPADISEARSFWRNRRPVSSREKTEWPAGDVAVHKVPWKTAGSLPTALPMEMAGKVAWFSLCTDKK